MWFAERCRRQLTRLGRMPALWGLLFGAAVTLGIRWVLAPDPLDAVSNAPLGASPVVVAGASGGQPEACWASQQLPLPVRLWNRSGETVRFVRFSALCRG